MLLLLLLDSVGLSPCARAIRSISFFLSQSKSGTVELFATAVLALSEESSWRMHRLQNILFYTEHDSSNLD